MSRTTIKVCLAILAVPLILMLLVVAGIAGYLPSKAAVAREFERRHVGWKVVDVTAVGGDEDGYSYVIRYRKPPETDDHEARWYVMSSGEFFGWKVLGEILDAPPQTASK